MAFFAAQAEPVRASALRRLMLAAAETLTWRPLHAPQIASAASTASAGGMSVNSGTMAIGILASCAAGECGGDVQGSGS